MSELAEKVCPVCGRNFTWRAQWAENWENVSYCSKRCRGRGVKTVDRELEQAILDLLAGRAEGKTICPSEVAKAIGGEAETDWHPLMEPVRMAVRRLAHAGKVIVLQHGVKKDPDTVKGPFRVKLTKALPGDST